MRFRRLMKRPNAPKTKRAEIHEFACGQQWLAEESPSPGPFPTSSSLLTNSPHLPAHHHNAANPLQLLHTTTPVTHCVPPPHPTYLLTTTSTPLPALPTIREGFRSRVRNRKRFFAGEKFRRTITQRWLSQRHSPKCVSPNPPAFR